MNTYEFWDEMDKIFDAIVAYQEKNIEFNNRFITPWVKLGNVFDKQESEAIAAHKNTIKIDPDNAQNWYNLAGAYTRSGDFDKSIQAYKKAIELGFESGELYKNLGLAHAMTAKHQEAIPFFQRALDLLDTDKDKAIVWNHIGNVYRKLNNYELALQAFQNADQLESAINTIAEELPSMEADEEIMEDAVAQVDKPSAPQTTDEPATVMDSIIVPEEVDPDHVDVDNTTLDNVSLEVEQTDEYQKEELDSVPSEPAVHKNEPPVANEYQTEDDEIDNDMPVILEVDFAADSSAGHIEETIADDVEWATTKDDPVAEPMVTLEEDEESASLETTQADPEAEVAASEDEPVAEHLATLEEDEESAFVETTQEESEAEVAASEKEPVVEPIATPEEDEESVSLETMQADPEAEVAALEDESVAENLAALEEDKELVSVETTREEPEAEVVGIEDEQIAKFLATLEKDGEPVLMEVAEENDNENDDEDVDFPQNIPVVPATEQPLENQALENSLDANEFEKEVKPTPEPEASSALSAYEEYLRDNDPSLTANRSEENQTIAMTPAEVEVTNSEINMEDVDANLTVDMDTKNAHVWNELGNVYFNAGSFDDAIAAYGRAIELDRQFAWPYTNLALSYVQKGSLAEAIKLYQRSIELFSNEKDKAITWNRLGNVYRRLNDYENAIAAYQRADELDPGNTAITHQSRFSLLGSEKVDQEARYSL